MMPGKALVLDANILIRAVLGQRVRNLILEYASTVHFFTPDVAYADARKYLPPLLRKRGGPTANLLAVSTSPLDKDASREGIGRRVVLLPSKADKVRHPYEELGRRQFCSGSHQ